MHASIRSQLTLKNVIQFIKYNLAGNVLFWGTYGLFFVFDKLLDWPVITALAVASILAHIAYFMVSKDWVFDETGTGHKTRRELVRFGLFMGLNYFLNIAIIYWLEKYFHISPYIGQFLSAFFFTLWSYIGLKYWVFASAETETKEKS